MNLIKQIKFRKRGFTLVEVLVATAIFVITMMTLSQIFISVIQSEKIAYSLLDSENIIRNNLEYMTRALRMGTKFNQHTNSEICFTNSQGVEQCFLFINNSLIQSLNGNATYLIDSSILPLKISAGTFYLFYPNDPKYQPIIRIQIWVQTEVKGKQYDFKVETAVTPRTLNTGI